MRPDFLIGIELTRHCNLRCAHCFRADLDQFSELPFDTLIHILDQAKQYDRPHIAFTGGEATLHKRFVEILEAVIERGFTFHFVTNGYNYKVLFRKLFHLFGNPLWKGVSFSLDGATPETHNMIRGEGSFERVLAGIAICRTHGLETVAQSVIHRGNRHELEALALLCSKMDVSRFHLAHLQPTPHAVEHGLLHSPQECRQVEREIIDLQGRFKMPIYLSAGFYDTTPVAHCRFLKLASLNIDHMGKLTMCCQLSNLEASEGEVDVVADLAKTSLFEAHQMVLRRYQVIFEERLQKMKMNTLQDIDNFHCWNCMKHTKKVEWMKDYPDNEWVKQDPYFQQTVKKLQVL